MGVAFILWREQRQIECSVPTKYQLCPVRPQRVSFTEMKCPKCGVTFEAGQQ